MEMELGKQIKKYRNELNMSQEELAEKIFVSRQTVSNWENDKNYPDIKSLLLLSEVFDVSLDNLVKGDIMKMKEMNEQISPEERARFERHSNIFTVLMLAIVILPMPLAHYFGVVGLGVFLVIVAVAMYFAIQIEKVKKHLDIQTYKEILAFTEGKPLDEIEKAREAGKRPYQNILKVLIGAAVGIVACTIMGFILGAF